VHIIVYVDDNVLISTGIKSKSVYCQVIRPHCKGYLGYRFHLATTAIITYQSIKL